MSGHSKWSQIKRQKGVTDNRRSAVFGKLSNAITIAARGGIDPEMNFQLRIAVDKARAANMPKDNIERAIDRAKGGAAGSLEEVIFEAYGPGGTAFLIETATDNRNRTIGAIRAELNHDEGKLAESGSVSYLFKKRGQIILETTEAEAAELAAIDAGAEDVESPSTSLGVNRVFIYTDPKELEQVRRKLAEASLESSEISFEYHPNVTVPITDQRLAERVIKLSEALDDLEDVTKVSSNFEVTTELLS